MTKDTDNTRDPNDDGPGAEDGPWAKGWAERSRAADQQSETL